MSLTRQHLIDPGICIRCNTCEETCPIDAITHDSRNYVVDPAICNACNDCLGPCPTGAIDVWRMVVKPYSLEEQFQWDDLPEEGAVATRREEDSSVEGEPEEVATQRAIATQAAPRAVPPWSAAHPYVHLYTREKPALARVVGNFRLTAEGCDSDTRHLILDLGTTAFPVLEGQSVGVLPPGTDGEGRPYVMRLYSVASPRDGERPGHNNIALTVKRAVEVLPDGSLYRGVASNYLCDLKKGDELRLAGPFGSTFLMPDHPGANLIMICTGTGSAPMRAMTERRRRHLRDAPGRLMLFFGARTPEELPYFGPLMNLPKEFIDVNLAFSRVPGQPKTYVQDRMRQRGDVLGELLTSPDTYVYICGIKGMEAGCLEAMADLVRHKGVDWKTLQTQMVEQGRLQVETY